MDHSLVSHSTNYVAPFVAPQAPPALLSAADAAAAAAVINVDDEAQLTALTELAEWRTLRGNAMACMPTVVAKEDEWWVTALARAADLDAPLLAEPARGMPPDMIDVGVDPNHHKPQRFVYTVHNFKVFSDGFPVIWETARRDTTVKYHVSGIETCPTTGRQHLQGYMELSNHNLTFRQLRARLFSGDTPWLAVARADARSNTLYCTKEGNFDMWGTPSTRPGQGHRSDWARVWEMVIEGRGGQEMADEVPHLVLPHVSRLPAWRVLAEPPRSRKDYPTRPIILCGPPGSGKSHWVRMYAPDAHPVSSRRSDEKIWDAECGTHDDLLIEEANGLLSFTTCKALFDITLFKGQIIGGTTVDIYAHRIFLTTNLHPAFWFQEYAWDDGNAWRRRIRDYGELWVFQAPTRHPPDADHPQGFTEYHPPVRDIALLPPEPATLDDHVAIERFARKRGGFRAIGN